MLRERREPLWHRPWIYCALLGLYAATTRATLDGLHPDGWVPQQKISIEEAVTEWAPEVTSVYIEGLFVPVPVAAKKGEPKVVAAAPAKAPPRSLAGNFSTQGGHH